MTFKMYMQCISLFGMLQWKAIKLFHQIKPSYLPFDTEPKYRESIYKCVMELSQKLVTWKCTMYCDIVLFPN